MCRITRVALVAHALAASLASAHPEGGLLVQANGDILFTYVYPMTMPDSSKHTACLWKLDASGQLHAVLKSEHDSSSFNITMGQDGHVYVGQRNYLGERHGADEYELRLVRLDSAGRPTPVISQAFQTVPRPGAERRVRRAEFNVHDFQDGTPNHHSMRCFAARILRPSGSRHTPMGSRSNAVGTVRPRRNDDERVDYRPRIKNVGRRTGSFPIKRRVAPPRRPTDQPPWGVKSPI